MPGPAAASVALTVGLMMCAVTTTRIGSANSLALHSFRHQRRRAPTKDHNHRSGFGWTVLPPFVHIGTTGVGEQVLQSSIRAPPCYLNRNPTDV
jgi:hypothetical protein